MSANQETVILWIALFVLLVGIVGVAIARLSHGRGASLWGGILALACIILVGAISITWMEACGRCWLVFTTTLPLMAVGATIDLRKTSRGTGF